MKRYSMYRREYNCVPACLMQPLNNRHLIVVYNNTRERRKLHLNIKVYLKSSPNHHFKISPLTLDVINVSRQWDQRHNADVLSDVPKIFFEFRFDSVEAGTLGKQKFVIQYSTRTDVNLALHASLEFGNFQFSSTSKLRNWLACLLVQREFLLFEEDIMGGTYQAMCLKHQKNEQCAISFHPAFSGQAIIVKVLLQSHKHHH